MTSGEAVTNVSIACNDSYKNKAGEKVDSVEFVNLVFYRKLAEIVAEYCKKGAPIYVEGKMKTRKYTDKAGVEKYSTEIVVDQMQMLGGKQSEHTEPARQDKPAQSQSSPAASTSETGNGRNFDNFDDDIPF
jgi:single-strand DNA-binding protein